MGSQTATQANTGTPSHPGDDLLGGNSNDKIQGQLDCWSALRWVGRGYERIRVFFADEQTAIAAGYRPCGHCMKDKYREWRSRQPGKP